MNRTHYLLASLLIAVLGLAIACVNADLPLEDHEIYVVRTVQEMHDRHDWLVPYFNGEPRLNKPPLSYWLTGVTAWLTHGLDDVRPWHGRMPSILAGLLMTLLIIEFGRVLYDRRTGLMAGLITVTCSGYFYYTHNARPEMVYSLFCMLGITCFAHAWRRWQQDAPSWLPVLGMWLAYALAMLTKGPQLPLMLILAMMIFMGMQGMAGRTHHRLSASGQRLADPDRAVAVVVVATQAARGRGAADVLGTRRQRARHRLVAPDQSLLSLPPAAAAVALGGADSRRHRAGLSGATYA